MPVEHETHDRDLFFLLILPLRPPLPSGLPSFSPSLPSILPSLFSSPFSFHGVFHHHTWGSAVSVDARSDDELSLWGPVNE